MKLLPVICSALGFVNGLDPLKCHWCIGSTLDNCIANGSTQYCRKAQESCMLTERRRNGVLMSVSLVLYGKFLTIFGREKFGQKSKILVKNGKFWSKIENFGQKSKILVNNQKFWSKILVKNFG